MCPVVCHVVGVAMLCGVAMCDQLWSPCCGVAMRDQLCAMLCGVAMCVQLCAKCPPRKDQRSRGVYVAAGLAILFVLTFLLIVAATRRAGGSVGRALFRARDFVYWTFVSWQTLVQVCVCLPAALHPQSALQPW